MKINEDIKGIKGWLLFVALEVVFLPFYIGTLFLVKLNSIGLDKMLCDLMGQEADITIRLNISILVAVLTFFFLLLLLFKAYLFFTKSYYFLVIFIGILVATIAFYLIYIAIIFWAIPSNHLLIKHTVIDILQVGIYSAIWIPYMLRSKRVKNTFVNRKFLNR